MTKDDHKIRLLIVDDNPATLDNLTKMLYFEHEVEIVGTASSGKDAIDIAKELLPDVVLMDINMPEMDGIQTTEEMRSQIPGQAVVIMSVQSELEYVRRAMVAGASDFLAKPFTSDELVNSLRKVYEREGKKPRFPVASSIVTSTTAASAEQSRRGKVIAVFSPKGGVGRTTVAVNLATTIRQETNQRVAIADFSMVFGDVGVLLNVEGKTVVDLVSFVNDLEPQILDDIMVHHSSGLRVLLAPPRPEMAELVTAEHITKIIAKMRDAFDFIVVDTLPTFQEVMLAVLDAADEIVVLATLELHVLKNIKLFLETAEALGYNAKKITMVVNRASSRTGISVKDMEDNINHKVKVCIANDWKLASFSANRGVPFVLSNRESDIAKSILDLARLVALNEIKPASEPAAVNEVRGRRLAIRLMPFGR